MPGRAAGIAHVALKISAGIRPFHLKILFLLFGSARFKVRRPRFRRVRRIPMIQAHAWRKLPEILNDPRAIDARARLKHQN